MPIPANFGFGEEEQMLRDAARKFFATEMPVERLHRLVADDPDPDRAPACRWEPVLWRQIAELGWSALAVPERAGGLGLRAVAAAALVEEAGRAAFPGPLLSTLQAGFLLAACDSPAADAVLARIVEGAAAGLGLCNARGAWRGADADLELREDRLYGVVPGVQDARKLDVFVLKARSADGICLVQVDAGASGLVVAPDSIVDLTRDQAHLVCDGVVPDAVLAAPGAATTAIAQAEPALFTLLAADMCGAAEWLLQTTVEYARLRKQFDHPLGFFQAIKHPLVDCMIQIDQARSHSLNAAAAIEHDPACAMRAAHMAKAAAGDAAVFGAGRAVQYHGGIGFTWECFVHLYFKRQMHSQAQYGDAVWHRARLAEMLMGPVGAAA